MVRRAAGGHPPVVLRGALSVETVRAGTGSEHEALVLTADDGRRLVLVKLGGPAFGLPDEARHAGRRVEVRGHLLGAELRYLQLDPL